MAVKIKFYYTLTAISLTVAGMVTGLVYHSAYAETLAIEPVRACVIQRDVPLNSMLRSKFAQCLGWQADASPVCHGGYQAAAITPLADPDEIQIQAGEASFYAEGRSQLTGNVEIRQTAGGPEPAMQ